MKRIVAALTACVTMTGVAHAEGRYLVADWDDNAVFVIDLETIKETVFGHRSWVYSLNLEGKTDTLASGKKYDEVRSLMEFDCKDQRKRSLHHVAYFKNGYVAGGEINGNWDYLVPDTMGWNILKGVCSPSERRTAFDSLETVRLFHQAMQAAPK